MTNTNTAGDSTPALLEKLGEGRSAELYAWGEGHVAKLFRERFPHAAVAAEFERSKMAHALGVPCPEPIALIDVQGRPGIVFEHCAGPTLLDLVRVHPEQAARHAEVLFELQQAVHACRPPAGLPRVKERLAKKIGQARDVTMAEKARALDRLQLVDAGSALCHGDFHPGNVLLAAAGPRVLDWSDAGTGSAEGDFAWTLLLLGFGRPGAITEATRAAFLAAYTGCVRTALGERYGELARWTLPLVTARLADADDPAERGRLRALLEAAR